MTDAMRMAAGAMVISAGMTGGGPAGAETLNYAFGYPAASTVGAAAEAYAEAVEQRSGGKLTIRNFPLSLLSLAEAGPGLRDGLADIAYVVAAYAPGDYPRYMLMQDLQLTLNLRELTGKESLAYAGAVVDYTVNHCPECLAEFEAQNQVYLSGATSSMNMMLCAEPAKSLADMEGLNVRVGVASVMRFLSEVDAVSLSFPANESYEALSQGVADCTVLSLPELTNMSLADVVTHVTTDVPGGLASSVAVGNVNREVWQSLDDEGRAAMLYGASQLSADISWGYYADALENEQVAAENEIELTAAEPALLEKLRDFSRDDIATVIESYEENYDIEDADRMAAEFREVLDEWIGLVAPVESRDELRDLYWNRIYKNIDPAAHGM